MQRSRSLSCFILAPAGIFISYLAYNLLYIRYCRELCNASRPYILRTLHGNCSPRTALPGTVPMMMALGHNDTWRVVINVVTPAPVISATGAPFYVHIYFRPTHTLFHSNHHHPPRPLHSAFNMTVYFKTSDLPNPILLTAPENIAFVRKLELK